MLSLGLAEADALADLELLGRAHERPPAAVVDALDQRRLDGRDRLAADPHAVEPRRDDPGVVDDERVAGLEEIRQVGDARVGQRAVRADDQHPGAVARRGGRERDALGRQVEIEGVDAHGDGIRGASESSGRATSPAVALRTGTQRGLSSGSL